MDRQKSLEDINKITNEQQFEKLKKIIQRKTYQIKKTLKSMHKNISL